VVELVIALLSYLVHMHSHLRPSRQGLVHVVLITWEGCHIVGGLELKVHQVLHLIFAWVDEDHSSSTNLLMGGSVEEECPVGLGED
jgi:hypothetical protein